MDTMPIVTPRQAGIYVRRSRESQGLTRARLAAAAGASERLLASLELGDATGIRLDKLLSILESLGISLSLQADPQFKAVAPSAPPQKEPRPTTYDELFRRITGNTTGPLPYASAENPQEPEDWQRGGF